MIDWHPTLLHVPDPEGDSQLAHILPGRPADYTVLEVYPGRFSVRDARGRCVYFGGGPVEVVRSIAPF